MEIGGNFILDGFQRKEKMIEGEREPEREKERSSEFSFLRKRIEFWWDCPIRACSKERNIFPNFILKFSKNRTSDDEVKIGQKMRR